MGSSSSTAKKQKAVSAFKQTVTENSTNNSTSSKEPVKTQEKKTTQNSATTKHNPVTATDRTNQSLEAANHNQEFVADSTNQNKDSDITPNQKPAVFSGLVGMDRWQDADIAGLLSELSLQDDNADIWKDTVDQLITRYDPKIQPDKQVRSNSILKPFSWMST